MARIESDSAEAKEVEKILATQMASFGLDESPEFVASYIVIMLCSDKPANDITSELVGLFGDKFPDGFAEWAYDVMNQVANGGYEQEPQPQSQKSGSERPSVSFHEDAASQNTSSNGSGGNIMSSNITSAFAAKPDKKGSIAGGISKGKVNSKLGKNLVTKQGHLNENMFSLAQMSNENDPNFFRNASQDPNRKLHPRTRCTHWPTCRYPGCKFPHPVNYCKYGDECEMPKGKCPFLHEGEEYGVASQSQYNMRTLMENSGGVGGMPLPPQMLAAASMAMGGFPGAGTGTSTHPRGGKHSSGFIPAPMAAPVVPAITLCKFSDKCANQQCPFGHPTPANSEAKVEELEWCEQKQACENKECLKAHPSGSLVRPPEPIPFSLEACKYKDRCTNPNCRYRHARSPIICRNGADCERQDCFFTHPLKEACKFGVNCANVKCLFQHPEGRDNTLAAGHAKRVWVRPQQHDENMEESQEQPQEQPQPQLHEQAPMIQQPFPVVENGS